MTVLKVFPNGEKEQIEVQDDSLPASFSSVANIELNAAASFCLCQEIIPDAGIVCYYSSEERSGTKNKIAEDFAAEDISMYGPVLYVIIRRNAAGWEPASMTKKNVAALCHHL